MEPENSLPYSQLPTTCPYPEPTTSSRYNPLQLLMIHLKYYPLIYVWVSPMAYFPQVSPPTPCAHLVCTSRNFFEELVAVTYSFLFFTLFLHVGDASD
jgi:hypothetical protein